MGGITHLEEKCKKGKTKMHLLPSSKQIITSCQFFLNITLPDIDSGKMGKAEAIDILNARLEYCNHYLPMSADIGDKQLQAKLAETKLACLTRLGYFG
jgi:hypothetical protein